MSTMRCKCRRQAETGLRCTRCSVPICPDCSKSAPVGFLCRTCADGKRGSRLYQVDARALMLGYLGTLAVALLGGWGMAYYGVRIGYFSFLLAFAFGNLIAEVALRITGRKRGLTMEIMGGLSTFLGIAGGLAFHAFTHGHYYDADGNLMTDPMGYIARQLSEPTLYIVALISVVGAVYRIRSL